MLNRVLLILAGVCFVTSLAHAGGNTKVKVCHIPPGNPDNFHTITVSEKAMQAHLRHGDLAGSCSAHAEALCDDGNPCTIDAVDRPSETLDPDDTLFGDDE